MSHSPDDLACCAVTKARRSAASEFPETGILTKPVMRKQSTPDCLRSTSKLA